MNDLFDLTDFILVILRRIKIIVISVFAGILLLASFAVLSSTIDMDTTAENAEAEKEEAEAIKKQIQTQERQIENQEKQIEIQKEQLDPLIHHIQFLSNYSESSYLMDIDPYNAAYNSTVYYIQAEENLTSLLYNQPSRAQAIAQAYLQTAGDLQTYLFENGFDIHTYGFGNVIQLTASGTDGNLLTTTVVGKNEKDADALTELIDSYLFEKQPQLEANIVPFEIRPFETVKKITYSSGIRDFQNTVWTDLTSAEQTLITTEDTITASEDSLKTMIDTLEETVEAQEEVEVDAQNSSITKIVTFAVIGGILGLFASIFIVFVIHVLDPRILGQRKLEESLGIRVLGTIEEGNI